MVRLFVAMAVIAAAAACSDASDGPTSPTPGPTSPVTLTGTYSGTVSDVSGPGRLTWQLTQSNADVSGTFSAVDEASGLSATGSVAGTVAGNSLTFRMSSPAGTLPPPFSSCSIALDGTAQVTASAIEGTYSGRNSCTGAFGNGRLSLVKQ